MDKKKKYNRPIIERFAIDKSISLAMESDPNGLDDGNWDDWGDAPSPAPPGGGTTFSGSKIEKQDAPNTFEQNPFK